MLNSVQTKYGNADLLEIFTSKNVFKAEVNIMNKNVTFGTQTYIFPVVYQTYVP